MNSIRVLLVAALVLVPALSAKSADTVSQVSEEFGFQFDVPNTGGWSQLDPTTMGDAKLALERDEPFALFMIYVSDFRSFGRPLPDELMKQSTVQRMNSLPFTSIQLTSEGNHKLDDLEGLRLQFQVELSGNSGWAVEWIVQSGGFVYELFFTTPVALEPVAAASEADHMFRRFALPNPEGNEATETTPRQDAPDR